MLLHKCVLVACVQLFVTPWTVARQAPLAMEFSREEYWSGLPFPSPGDFPDPGKSNPGLLHCRYILYHLSYQGSPLALSRLHEIFFSQSKGIYIKCNVELDTRTVKKH